MARPQTVPVLLEFDRKLWHRTCEEACDPVELSAPPRTGMCPLVQRETFQTGWLARGPEMLEASSSLRNQVKAKFLMIKVQARLAVATLIAALAVGCGGSDGPSS